MQNQKAFHNLSNDNRKPKNINRNAGQAPSFSINQNAILLASQPLCVNKLKKVNTTIVIIVLMNVGLENG